MIENPTNGDREDPDADSDQTPKERQFRALVDRFLAERFEEGEERELRRQFIEEVYIAHLEGEEGMLKAEREFEVRLQARVRELIQQKRFRTKPGVNEITMAQTLASLMRLELTEWMRDHGW